MSSLYNSYDSDDDRSSYLSSTYSSSTLTSYSENSSSDSEKPKEKHLLQPKKRGEFLKTNHINKDHKKRETKTIQIANKEVSSIDDQNTNGKSNKPDDIFDDIFNDDSYIESFRVSNNSPVLQIKTHKTKTPENDIANHIFEPIQSDNILVKLEFQMRPFDEVDDSSFECLLKTKYTNNILLDSAKKV